MIQLHTTRTHFQWHTETFRAVFIANDGPYDVYTHSRRQFQRSAAAHDYGITVAFRLSRIQRYAREHPAPVAAGDRIAAEPSVTSEPALEAGSVKRLAICNSAQGGVS